MIPYLAMVAIGGAVIGGSLMAHTPLIYDWGWLGGVVVGGILVWRGWYRVIAISEQRK